MSLDPRAQDPAIPEADAMEQSRDWAEPEDDQRTALPPDVSELDALDQARPADLDDEEH
jgi:hypothetical protein